MAQTLKSPSREKCCDFTKGLPDPIQSELNKQGGMEGLLARFRKHLHSTRPAVSTRPWLTPSG